MPLWRKEKGKNLIQECMFHISIYFMSVYSKSKLLESACLSGIWENIPGKYLKKKKKTNLTTLHVFVGNNSWRYYKRWSIWRLSKSSLWAKEICQMHAKCTEFKIKMPVITIKLHMEGKFLERVLHCFVTWHKMDRPLLVMGKIESYSFGFIVCCYWIEYNKLFYH